MAYEREAIVATPTPVQQSTPLMKEERVINPYQSVKKPTLVGQPDTNSVSASPEEPGVTAAPVTLSPAAAALARKEQKFRQEQAKLKAEKQEIEAERAKIAKYADLENKLKAKDYSLIEELVPYQDYTDYLLKKQSEMSPERQELNQVKAKLEGLEKAQQDDVSKRFDAAVDQRRKEVAKLVEADKAFTRIKKAGAQEAVLQHILDTWEHDDIDLSPEQAAKEVEELLKERAQKWSTLNQEEPEAATETDPKVLPPLKPAIKTLTNNMAATGEITRPKKSFQGMSDAERYAEARRRAEEKLKKG